MPPFEAALASLCGSDCSARGEAIVTSAPCCARRAAAAYLAQSSGPVGFVVSTRFQSASASSSSGALVGADLLDATHECRYS